MPISVLGSVTTAPFLKTGLQPVAKRLSSESETCKSQSMSRTILGNTTA
jgi:hypothetical protein